MTLRNLFNGFSNPIFDGCTHIFSVHFVTHIIFQKSINFSERVNASAFGLGVTLLNI